ncbi:MAG: phage tail length tape measure family protein, partial [Shewanella sp.]
MRNIAGQLGYQLQDIAVQAQMGVSAFTILGQQGSQLLSAIGPAGAIAGALLAVGAAAGSALAPSLMKAKDSAADLEVALDDLKKVVGTTADDTDVLTERVLKLAAANREAAKTEVALGITKAKDAIAASSDIIGEAITKADGWTNATGSMSKAVAQLPALTQIMDRFGVSQAEALDGNIPAEFQRRIEALSTYIGTLGEEFGMTRSQALQFVQAADEFTRLKTPEAATKLATTINSINEANGYANRSLVELGAAVGENTRTMQDAADKANILTNALSGIEQAAKQSEEAIARNSSAIKGLIESATMEAETIGKSDRARALYVAGLAKATEAEMAQINAQYDKIEAFEKSQQAQKEAEAAAKKAASESESAQKKLESQYTANENSLKRMAQQLTIAGLSTQGLARDAAMLAAAYSLGDTATEAQIEQARQLAGALFDVNEQKRTQKEIDSRNKELKQKFDPIGSTSDKYAEESAMLLEARQKDIITEDMFQMQKDALATQYEQKRLAAAEELYRAQSEGNAFVMDSVNALGQASTSTISGLLSGTMSATEAMQNFANIILNQAVGALVGMGIEYVKQQLLQQTMAASASAAQIGIATTTGTAVASAWAPAAAMVSLATMGTNAGPAEAALATVTGTAAGLAVSGGRQFGGPVNPGSMYRVGEGNSPELFSSGGSSYMIPGSRGQVTPMDGVGGGVTFNITNNASDMVQTQQSYDPETKTV